MQYIIARNWPLKGFLMIAMIMGLVWVIQVWRPVWGMLSDWSELFFFIVSLLTAPVLAFFFGLFAALPLLVPLYRFQAWRNGAPYQVGDQVRILVGPYRYREVHVYAVWKERGQVRVELDEEMAKAVKDVFSDTHICLVTPRVKAKGP